MRLLCVCPGAAWSTADVYAGLTKALEQQGVEVIRYDLATRISRAASWLLLNYRRAKQRYPEIEKPSQADVFYQAGLGVIERALRFAPDWVVIFSAMYFHPDLLVMLKRAGLRLAVLFSESPYDDARQAELMPLFDVACTNERTSVPLLQAANPDAIVEYLPHAYDPAIHKPEHDPLEDPPCHDVVFVGTGWPERIALFSAVDWDGISRRIGREVNVGLYGSWTRLGSRHRLRRFVRRGPVENAQAAALYRWAKVGINLHRSPQTTMTQQAIADRAESLNPRCYELAACGTFWVSDPRAELEDVFGPGVVPTFRDAGELTELLAYYLDRPEERQARAAALQAAVAPHTFDARAALLLETLRQAAAPVSIGRVA